MKEAQQIENGLKYKLQQEQNGIIPKTPSKTKHNKTSLCNILNLYVTYNQINNKQRKPKEKIKTFIEFFGEDKDVKLITPFELENLRMWLRTEKHLSNSTINKYMSCLSKSFNLALDEEIIEKNPCTKIKKLKEPKETIKFYTKEEENKLIETTKIEKPSFLNFLLFAFNTGFRLSNIQFLTWEQIDFKNRLIQIQPQDNKGFKEIRIYMTDELCKILKSINRTDKYVFINPETNKPFCAPNRILSKLCKIAQIKHIGIHGIRHTACTRMAEKKVPPNVIQQVFAHSDIRTTMKYIHTTPQQIQEAMNILSAY